MPATSADNSILATGRPVRIPTPDDPSGFPNYYRNFRLTTLDCCQSFGITGTEALRRSPSQWTNRTPGLRTHGGSVHDGMIKGDAMRAASGILAESRQLIISPRYTPHCQSRARMSDLISKSSIRAGTRLIQMRLNFRFFALTLLLWMPGEAASVGPAQAEYR